MENILLFLRGTYQPLAMILYGSYADGSNNQDSDFDVLLVVREGEKRHDSSVIGNVQLDAFVYPLAEIDSKDNFEDFVQLLDGAVIWDTDNIGQCLLERVKSFFKDKPLKSIEENRESVAWCKKMLRRTERGDAEGYFRRHWLLVDSLEIACDILQTPYHGPKKSLKWLQQHRPDWFDVYNRALQTANKSTLENWISCLESGI